MVLSSFGADLDKEMDQTLTFTNALILAHNFGLIHAIAIL